MSSKFTHAMTYWCDHSGCGAKAFVPSGELPEGWLMDDSLYVQSLREEPGPTVVFMRHYCPAHAVPVQEAPNAQ